MKDLPVGTDGVTVRLRVGAFPVVNTVLAVVFVPVFVALSVVAVAAAVRGQGAADRTWAVVGAAVAVLGTVVMLTWLGVSINGLRAVLVVTGADGTISVPCFSFGRGFHREVLALAGTACHLDYRGGVHNKRWQLVVRHRGHAEIHCDSVTSGRGPGPNTRDTPAGRTARWLDTEARTARQSRDQP